MNKDKYGYFLIRIKYKKTGLNEELFNYLKNQEIPFNQLVLDSLRMLWMPYVLASVGMFRRNVVREIDICYEKWREHFNVMCLELEHEIRRDASLLVIDQAQAVTTSMDAEVEESEEGLKLNKDDLYEKRKSILF